MKLKYTLAVLAATSLFANGATPIIYSQDFQSFAADTTNPDGWTGVTRAFRAAEATTEDGTNDTALIATATGNYSTEKDLGFAILPNTTYTLSLKAGFYSSTAGNAGTFKYSLGTGTGVAFTALSPESTASLTQATTSQYFFGAGNNVALPDLVFTTGAIVSSDNLVIHLRGEGSSFQGFDNIVLTAVPEPSSAALLGLASLTLLRRRRK